MIWDSDTAYSWNGGSYPNGVYERSLSNEEAGLSFDGAVRYWSNNAPPSNGSFVSYGGNVYRIAGGAPLYVSNWTVFGGPQPTQALSASQWGALNSVPANDTFISDPSTGMVYVTAGGAPLYVSTWSAVGGPQPVIAVDPWDLANISDPLAHLNAVPANGTFLNADGPVYVVAGGAPLFVSNWANVGGPQPSVTVDPWDLINITDPAAHLNTVPANDTFLNADGPVYVVVGGAPLFVSNWANVGGIQPYVTIDGWDIANITNSAAHLNPVPVDGSFIRDTTNGAIYTIAGGAPLYVANCANVNGCPGDVNVDDWDLANITNPAAHLNPVPSDGTYLLGSAGGVYRVAGGDALSIDSCQYLGGCPGQVLVDQNAIATQNHLNATPTDGTVLEGEPSGSFWTYSGGCVTGTGSSASAVTVTDDAIRTFETCGTPGVATAYTALAPFRVCDTRPNSPTAQCAGKTLGPRDTLSVQITGGGVPSAAQAVVVNLTAINESATATYITAFPSGGSAPTASNINLAAGAVGTNLAFVQLNSSGQLSLFNAAGSANVIVDVEGYFSPAGPAPSREPSIACLPFGSATRELAPAQNAVAPPTIPSPQGVGEELCCLVCRHPIPRVRRLFRHRMLLRPFST